MYVGDIDYFFLLGWIQVSHRSHPSLIRSRIRLRVSGRQDVVVARAGRGMALQVDVSLEVVRLAATTRFFPKLIYSVVER